MLDRNKRIKPRPERFQNCKDLFDLILTCEERVYDQVVEGECTYNTNTRLIDIWLPWATVVETEGTPTSSDLYGHLEDSL